MNSHRTLFGREWLSCNFLAALAVAAGLLCAGAFWFALPREAAIRLGHISDFAPGPPHYRALRSDLAVFLVNRNGQLIAWDARPRVAGMCRIRWVGINNRFEDPCTGAKWCIDGSIADDRFGARQTLGQYTLEIEEGGEVFLHPSQKISGRPVSNAGGRARPGDTLPPAEMYDCQHLN